MQKIPKSEALILAKHGIDIFGKLDREGNLEGYYKEVNGTAVVDVKKQTRASPLTRATVITRSSKLMLRPIVEHKHVRPDSCLGRAVKLIVKLGSLTTKPSTRQELTKYLQREMKIPERVANQQISEMIHRRSVLKVAD